MKTSELEVPVYRLVLVLVLTAIITLAELILAQLSHSITLLVLFHQNIYNVLTLVVSCVTRSRDREEESLKNTFGWRRLEVVGSLSSLVFLFSLCFASAVEAVQTLFHSDHLDTFHHRGWILVILAANLVVWLVAVVAMGGFSQHQTRSVAARQQDRETRAGWSSLEISDLGRDLSVGLLTLLTCSLVQLQVVTEQYCQYVDPAIALLSISQLVRTSCPILNKSCLILLQTIPGLGTDDFSS